MRFLVLLAGCSSAAPIARPPVVASCSELHVEEDRAITDDANWPELLLDERDNPVVFWSHKGRQHREYVQDGTWHHDEDMFPDEPHATDGARFLRSSDPTKTFDAVVSTMTYVKDPTGRSNPKGVTQQRLYAGPPWSFVREVQGEVLPKYWLHERPEAQQPPRVENVNGVTTLVTEGGRVALATDDPVSGSDSQRVFFPYHPVVVRQRDRLVVVGFRWTEHSEARMHEPPHGTPQIVRDMPKDGEGELLIALIHGATPKLITLPMRFSDWVVFRHAVDRFQRIHLIANETGKRWRLRYIRLGCG